MKTVLIGGGHNFGESNIVHLPNNKIGIIDCFNNPTSEKPQPVEYLKAHGIDPENVEFILLTHFHSDHISGIIPLLDLCQTVTLFVPSIVCEDIFLKLVGLAEELQLPIEGMSKVIDLVNYLRENNRRFTPVSADQTIYNNSGVQVIAHSPTSPTIDYFNEIYDYIVNDTLSKWHNGDDVQKIENNTNFNQQSIVLSIVSENHTELLCGDLEYDSDSSLGLGPVLHSISEIRRRYDVLKVSHHGSKNCLVPRGQTPSYSNFKDYKSFLNNDEAIFKLTSKAKTPCNLMSDLLVQFCPRTYITTKSKEKKFKDVQYRLKQRLKRSKSTLKVLPNDIGSIMCTYSSIESDVVISISNHASLL